MIPGLSLDTLRARRPSERAIERVYDALGPQLGEGGISRDPDLLLPYGEDQSGAGSFPPQLLARPRSSEAVSEILRACAAHGVPVVPRGAGTGRAGGALPVAGGLVLSLEGMAAIQRLEPASLTVTVQPGLITGDLHAAVEEAGLFYPPDPNSLESCQIGGNVATNASGPRAVKYGATGDYVRALHAVQMGGQRLDTGRPTLKCVAGYDLSRLLVGSEGTLAVITEITLRLRPRPQAVTTALLTFTGVQAASEVVLSVFRAGHSPRTLELMDPAAIDAARPLSAYRFPEGRVAALLLELDGAPAQTLDELAEIAELAQAHPSALEVIVAQDEVQRRALWEARRVLSPALRQVRGRKYSEDVAVPLGQIPAMIDAVHAIAAGEGLEAAIYGHAGEGNLHVNLLFSDEAAWPSVGRAAEAIFRAAVSLGGTITGEHGVGLLKRGYLPIEQAPPLIALQRQIKALFDPADLLNPGKVLPPE